MDASLISPGQERIAVLEVILALRETVERYEFIGALADPSGLQRLPSVLRWPFRISI